jgi:hypothetical protein
MSYLLSNMTTDIRTYTLRTENYIRSQKNNIYLIAGA